MRVAIVTFDGFNELDSFIALGLVNRLSAHGVRAELCCPTAQVTSMNGVTVSSQQPLEFVVDADAVLFGSGIYTRAIAENPLFMDRLVLDPTRQLIGAQCSGTLLLARLGLLGEMPACTDLTTKPWVVEAGVRVADAPFLARGPIATAGGCMASAYLATWVMWRAAGREAARQALHYAAPVGEKDAWVDHALAVVGESLGEDAPA
ncbi:MAG TPA: AraC family transcriptional regulator [Burkholderiaceae bacterium]